MIWCPRCGTSLSQHELTATDCYRDLTHPSLFVYLPLADGTDEARRGVDDDAVDAAGERRRRGRSRRRLRRRRRAGPAWPGCWRRASRPCSASGSRVVRQREGLRARRPRRTSGRSTSCRRSEGVEHRAGRVGRWSAPTRAPASSTSRPAAARRTSTSAASSGLPVLVPVDDSGAFYEQYGWLHGRHTADARQPIIEDLGQRGRLLRAEELTHRYPTCWRCGTRAHLPRRRRVVHLRRRRPRADDRGQPRGRVDARASTASGWRTGCATWATGASRASATGACRCRSTGRRPAR